MKRSTAIIILILVLLGGTALLYFAIGGKTPAGIPIFTGSPFGTAPVDSGNTGTPRGASGSGVNGSGSNSTGSTLARFLRLTDVPIAGAVSILKDGSTYVRYVERATGHVFDINSTTLQKTEILNMTQPRVYKAIWKEDGSGFVERTLINNSEMISDIAVSIIPPKASSTFYTSQTSLLRGNIGELDALSDGSLIYNLTDSGSVVTSLFTGEKPKTLLTLDFTDWLIKGANASAVLLLTKPSASAEGYAYLLNPKTGGFTKLLGPLSGLSALQSPDGKRLAYNYTRGDVSNFSVFNLSSGLTTNVYPATIPDKCSWSKKTPSIIICGVPESGLGKDVPDLWYQGVVSYSDRVWRFNVDTNTAEILVDPRKDFDTSIDVIDPILSNDEDYLFFTDKNTLSLWALKL